MFEVGKVYECRELGFATGNRFSVSYFDGEYAFGYAWNLSAEPRKFPTVRSARDFIRLGHTEVPPEPKRWSTWQNVYAVCTGPITSLEDCKIGSLTSAGPLARIRRDWESWPGEEKCKCVKVELEKV